MKERSDTHRWKWSLSLSLAWCVSFGHVSAARADVVGDWNQHVITVGGPLPFALQSASQFRPNGPDALRSARYARDLTEVQLRGALAGSTRTVDEDVIARWHTEQAQFQFNRIARAETPKDGRELIEHARLFALQNTALADATMSVFEAKYTFNWWRPATAIRRADIDGNPDTFPDPPGHRV